MEGKENCVRLVYSGETNKADQLNLDSIVKKCISGSPDKSFTCHVCNKFFLSKHSLAKHLRTHKSIEGHECDKCNKKFTASRDLKKHIDIVHLNKKEMYKKECPICHTRVQQLKTHIRFIHRNEAKSCEYNNVCPKCDKTFSNDYKVKRHIQTVHEGVKNWQCTICPKRFSEKKDLGRHVRGVHMGLKVDTWRSRKTSDGSRKVSGQIVSKNFLSTADLMSSSKDTALPVNVMECDDRQEETEEGQENKTAEELQEDGMVDGFVEDYEEMEISEVEPVKDEEVEDCRFQVCQQRLDEDGDLVLEIEEKGGESSVDKQEGRSKVPGDKGKMVTLRWGETGPDNVASTEQTPVKINKVSSKMIDLNLRLEDIIHSADIGGEDFVLPEVVGDLPGLDWFLHTSNDIDILKMNTSDSDITAGDSQGKDSPEETNKTAFRCGACGKMFISLEFLKSHIEKAHIESGAASGFTSPSKTVFRLKTEEAAEAGPAVLVCSMDGCGKQFQGKGKKLQYKRHVERIHLAIRNKQCPRCDMKFYEKRDLQRHVEAIHMKIRTICPIEGCGKPVVRLDQHIRVIHSDKSTTVKQDKSSKCPECGAVFSRVYDMTRHRENVHRGLKNFACDKCDRKFADKRDLTRHHDAVHLNIKQSKTYTCSSCQKTFKFKKLLDKHRLDEHEGETIPVLASKPASDTGREKLVVTADSSKDIAAVEKVEMEDQLNTVEIDGQLFLVQETGGSISLLPVVQSQDNSPSLALLQTSEPQSGEQS